MWLHLIWTEVTHIWQKFVAFQLLALLVVLTSMISPTEFSRKANSISKKKCSKIWVKQSTFKLHIILNEFYIGQQVCLGTSRILVTTTILSSTTFFYYIFKEMIQSWWSKCILNSKKLAKWQSQAIFSRNYKIFVSLTG